jgi:hypothetical protein
MLRRRQDRLRLHSAHERGDEAADRLRIFTEAARVDDRIVGIDVHVGDRREDVIDADGAPFHRRDLPRFFGQRRIAGRSDGHRRRPVGRVGETHPDSRLEVGAHQQRHFRLGLQPSRQPRRFVDIGHEPDHAADFVLAHLPPELPVAVRVFVHEIAVRRVDEHLADLLVERKSFDARHGGRAGGERHREQGNPKN